MNIFFDFLTTLDPPVKIALLAIIIPFIAWLANLALKNSAGRLNRFVEVIATLIVIVSGFVSLGVTSFYKPVFAFHTYIIYASALVITYLLAYRPMIRLLQGKSLAFPFSMITCAILFVILVSSNMVLDTSKPQMMEFIPKRAYRGFSFSNTRSKTPVYMVEFFCPALNSNTSFLVSKRYFDEISLNGQPTNIPLISIKSGLLGIPWIDVQQQPLFP